MSENSFEKNKLQNEQLETKVEKEIKAVEEKYEKLLKEQVKQDNAEMIEYAFELYKENPEFDLKKAMYLLVNKTSDELINGHFQIMREHRKNNEDSTSPKEFFNEIPPTIH